MCATDTPLGIALRNIRIHSRLLNALNGLVNDINHFGKTVEELWTDFAKTLNKLSQECIPSRIIRGKSSLPWITQEIKRLIRKRNSKNLATKTLRPNFRPYASKSKRKLKIHTRAILKISWASTTLTTPATAKNFSPF